MAVASPAPPPPRKNKQTFTHTHTHTHTHTRARARVLPLDIYLLMEADGLQNPAERRSSLIFKPSNIKVRFRASLARSSVELAALGPGVILCDHTTCEAIARHHCRWPLSHLITTTISTNRNATTSPIRQLLAIITSPLVIVSQPRCPRAT